MNLEEAKANIGKEVVLDESTKPYYVNTTPIGDTLIKMMEEATKLVLLHSNKLSVGVNFYKNEDLIAHIYIDPRHLKLKEQQMNYKIRVTPETSKEVQELFFELGFEWMFNGRDIMEYTKDLPNIFLFDSCLYNYISKEKRSKLEEITLPQLRDMVVLKRNDVSDATHKSDFVGHRFFVASDNKAYEFREDKWQPKICKSFLEPIVKHEPQMTWQDALRAVADGKEIQQYCLDSWIDIHQHIEFSLYHFKNGKFRLKPKTVTLEARPYTKEELLKIAGEME